MWDLQLGSGLLFSVALDRKLLKLVRRLIQGTGVDFFSRSENQALHLRLNSAELDADFLRFLSAIESSVASGLIQVMGSSTAQLRQDLVVLGLTGLKREGFFVEFGATDGTLLSNTWLLENEFGWSGILAEPATFWHEKLQVNRHCALDFSCVSAKSGGKVPFLQADVAELSTVVSYSKSDGHSRAGVEYLVETISLNDLLEKHNAPRDFDYLSVDTEGSELDILSELDFEYWKPRVLMVEHNYTSAREGLHTLLTGKGYVKVFSDLSRWDSWYVLQSDAAMRRFISPE